MIFQAQKQTKASVTPSSGLLQRKCSDCKKKLQILQRRSVRQFRPESVPPIVHEVLRSPGQPLDRETREFMEPRFEQDFRHVRAHSMALPTHREGLFINPANDSYEQEADNMADKVMGSTDRSLSSSLKTLKRFDFSRVRLHVNSQAADSARQINALAYTVGQDIVFGNGLYEPRTKQGRRILAHELTHVAQQNAQNHLSVFKADNRKEANQTGATSTCPNPVFYIHLDLPLVSDKYFQNGIEQNESTWNSNLRRDRARPNSCEIRVSREIEVRGPNPTINVYLIYTRNPCCNCFMGAISWNVVVNGNRQVGREPIGTCQGGACCNIIRSVPISLSVVGQSISGTITINGSVYPRTR